MMMLVSLPLLARPWMLVHFFFDGLFSAFAAHLVGFVVFSLFILLDYLGPTDLALLLGTIHVVIVGR
jgi:hypothetical protein